MLRDIKGSLILAFGHYYGCHTSVWAEAKAIMDGLQFVKRKSISKLWLELDSQLHVNILQGNCVVPWNISYIIKEIQDLMPQQIFISHIYKEGNQGVDFMANWGV